MPAASPPASPVAEARVSKRTGPRVLIVRPSALGDVARTVPALVTLRRAMPEAHIDWLVQDSYADVVRHHPALDGVVEFPRRGFGGLLGPCKAWRWSRQLRAGRYDIAIDLQGLFRSGWMTWRTGAAKRIGFANAREWAWLGYNRRHRVDDRLHTVDHMLALLEAEGYTPVRDMRLYLGDQPQRWLAEQVDQSRPYVCLAPAAQWRCKCWPIENYISIARRLLERGPTGVQLVLLAAPHERLIMQPIIDALGSGAPVSMPTTTVGQMMALVSQASLFVGNDTGPLHVAVGFDRPLVAIFGPTDPALVGPYRRDDDVVRPPGNEGLGQRNYYRKMRDDQSLIARVSVDMVWEKIECALNQQIAPPSRT